MNFKGKAKRINDLDIPRIGSQIGVGEDELHAFMDVEAAGSGFDSVGRPKMLFEPHLFYRELSGAKRDEAVKAGLAYAKWKRGAYPPESYTRLAKAMAIDEEAALRSASWGLTQILGKWHNDIGYATARAMVEAFMADEAAHLDATIKLLIQWGVADDLKAHRWAVVADAWNGPQYAVHGYHTKLAKAHAKWDKIRDTVWPPKDWKPDVPILTPEMIDKLPAAPDKHTDVVVVDSPKDGETLVVAVPDQVNKPAQPKAALPKSRTGIMALAAILMSFIAGAARYFFGG